MITQIQNEIKTVLIFSLLSVTTLMIHLSTFSSSQHILNQTALTQLHSHGSVCVICLCKRVLLKSSIHANKAAYKNKNGPE